MANQTNSSVQSVGAALSAVSVEREVYPHHEPNILVRAVRFVRQTLAVYLDPVGYARSIGVHIGENCHIWGSTKDTFGSEPYMIRIGHNVSITHGCNFITHDGGIRIFRTLHPDIDIIEPIVIGNNVFIGAHTVILAGVTIGDNCVIGAGSVVTRDIPADSLALGSPARRVRSLDEYWDTIKDNTIPTFHMSAAAKRKYLEARYHKELFE